MKVKIDTREKFHVITIQEINLAANMTEEIKNSLVSYLKNPVKNVVLNCKDIQIMETAAAEELVNVQQTFYEQNASFVICCLNPVAEKSLDEMHLLEMMNTTPTESEAGDIVLMEEIERELLEGLPDEE